MAYRDKTREFVRRRNARSSQPHRSWEDRERGDNTRLLGREEQERKDETEVPLPPEWVDDIDEAHELIASIKSKIKDLAKMHEKHVNAPVFDDKAEEERAIEIATAEITALFHKCQKTIQTIGRKGKAAGSQQEQKVTDNVMRSVAGELQSLSQSFRKSQSDYLKRIKGREDRDKNFGFATELGEAGAADPDDDIDFDVGFTQAQKAVVKDNTALIETREQEITNIVKSIEELATIFKDLAVLVVDQGTVLDRIDWNLQQAETHIVAGREELQQSEKYQKSASKKYLIILLCLVVLGMILGLIISQKATKKKT